MTYINSGGIKLATYEFNKGCGEPIFFIHGWPLSHKIFEYQINIFIELGYHVVTMDLRGFGASDTSVCGYDYNQMAKDVYTVVMAYKLNRFTLAGFSMGGAIALRYMRLFNGYGVKKLILLAAAAPCFTKREDFPYGNEKRMVDDLIAAANTDRAGLCEDFSRNKLFALPHSNAIIEWFNLIALGASSLGTINSAVSLRDEDGREDLKCVNIPTYIICGGKDIVVPAELTDYQHKEIKGSKLLTLKNSGHCIMYDELEDFNNTLIKSITEN